MKIDVTYIKGTNRR